MSRFPVLSTISLLLKGLAALVGVSGFIAGIIRGDGDLVVIWIGSVICGVGLWAYAEIIAVVLAIEENTYETRQALSAQTWAGGSTFSVFGTAGGESSAPTSPLFRGPARSPIQRASGSGRSLRLSPPSGSPGATVRAEASGFPPGAVIALNWVGVDGAAHVITTLNATPQGYATWSFTVPEWETAGQRQLEVAASRGAKASALFTVVETGSTARREDPPPDSGR